MSSRHRMASLTCVPDQAMTSRSHASPAARQRASRTQIPCPTVSTHAGPADPRLMCFAMFILRVAAFVAASALCAAAPAIQLLVAARIVQGGGGALLTPGSLAIIDAVFAPGDRTRAIGAWAGLTAVAAAAGARTVNRRRVFPAGPAVQSPRRPVRGLFLGTTLRRPGPVRCPQRPRFPSGTGRCSCRPPARLPRACQSRSRPRHGIRPPVRGR